METTFVAPTCPRCRAVIPPEAPGGLCPKCVLLGAATPSDSGRPARRVDPPSVDQVRAAFPTLEILELIGQGGMGFVYSARQPQLDRTVALKLLPITASSDPAFTERFAREGRLLARLNHPNIVTVYDFGQTEGFCFLIMEFVDGVNLRQAMRSGRFSPSEALAIVPEICAALQFAHERGVLHRDIKPENILLDARGRVKIADFGIGKLVGDRATDITLTASGARLGTPHYMAPEQIESPSEVDHRADIYSLGVVFYELLTGELPLGRFAPPSAKADLDARVDEIVLRALAKERELRQQSAGEVKTQVESLATSAAPSPEADPRTGEPAAAPAPVVPRPFQLRDEHKPLALVLLLAAFPLLAASAIPAATAFIPSLRWDTHPFIGAVLVSGALWLMAQAWSGRERLLTPLGIPSGQDPEAPRSVLDRFLYGAAVAVLLLLTLRLATTGMTIFGSVFGSVVTLAPAQPFLVAAMVLVQLGLMAWILRESRLPADRVPSAQIPRGLRRVAVLFLLYAALASLPAILPHEANVRVWPLPIFLALVGIALLTRNRNWRNIALAAVGLLAIQSLVSLVTVLSFLGSSAKLPGGTPVGIGALTSLQGALTAAAGIWVLCRRDVKVVFGIDAPPLATPSHPAAPTLPGPESGASWSVRAILGGLLTLLTFLTTIVAGLVVPGLMRRGTEAGEAYLNVVATTILLAFLPAIVGMVLGWSALAKLRAAKGAQRGLGLAVGAALLWPMVLIFPLLVSGVRITSQGRGLPPSPDQTFFMLAIAGGLIFDAVVAIRVSRWATETYPAPGVRTWPAYLWLAVILGILFPTASFLLPRTQQSALRANIPATTIADPASASIPVTPTPMIQDSAVLATRAFSLKHQDAAALIEASRQILLGQPGREALAGRDTTELVVTATRLEMNRISALVTVMDFPEPIQNFPEASGGYRDPVMLTRAFFYACAIRDPGAAIRLLSSNERERLARASIPVETCLDSWMRYPLRRLTLQPGVALGFAERHFVSAVFDEAPDPFVQVSAVAELAPSVALDPHQGRPLWIDTQPPWLESLSSPAARSTAPRAGPNVTPSPGE